MAEQDHAPGTLIVKFSSDDESEISAFLNRSGVYSFEHVFPTMIHRKHDPCRLSAIYQLKLSPNTDVASMARQYENDPLVEYAQPNYLNRLCSESAPDDFFYQQQWALQAIDAPEAWKIEKGSPDVVVAVVDTGVEYDHEDLESRIWINPGEVEGNGVDDDGNGYVDDIRGWDFADSPGLYTDIDHKDRDNDPMDENGHGTHVAGIISAVPDNSVGVAGITWNCRIMALRAGGDFLEDDDVSAAIVYAADNGARVINMSWGSDHLAYVVRDATKYAYDRGCVLVAAVGNDNRPDVIYPALYKHVIAVGATDKWDRKASFSNYGPGVDIAAPGHRVFATILDSKYSDWSGTSMASPVVSGVAALMLSKRSALTNEEVAQILRASADRIDEPLFSGAGRVNAAKALTASSLLVARITAPDSGSGGDKVLIIRGTAAGSDFHSFRLEYSLASETDWKPLGDVQNVPVFDELLETWDVAQLDEGIYAIKLTVSSEGRLETADKVILHIDHSPPEITHLQAVARLYGDTYSYAVTWLTDDPASGELYYRAAGSMSEFQRLTTSAIATEHAVYMSGEVSPGDYEYFVAAVNPAGLTTVDDNNGDYHPLEVKALRVKSDGFLETATSIPAIRPVAGTADFDGDGQPEIVGMIVSDYSYDQVRIYEKGESGTYDEVFASDEDYFPWDMGDTDKDGLIEILGSRKDATFLYESPEPGSYPTEKIWEMEGIQGGQIADMDLDGRMEIVSRNLDTSEIIIYENRGDNSYLKTARLRNPTEGQNSLASSFAISDLDGDGWTDIAAGDSDGDIFVYRNMDNDRYLHTWTGSIPHSAVGYVIAGDFDGDGSGEFIAGGRAAEPSNLAREKWKYTRWVYTIFDSVGQNEYEAVWSQEIIGAKLEGGVSAGDIDGDGRDEIVILATPNLYVFKYAQPGTCDALWYRSTGNIGKPLTVDLDSDGVDTLFFNAEDELLAFEYAGSDYDLIHRPWGVSAVPLGESAVELHWNGPPDAHSYMIYRGLHVESLQPLTLVQDKGENWEVIRAAGHPDMGYFRDTGLETGVEYWYAVSLINESGEEGTRSRADSATPNSPPRLLSAKYVPPHTVVLDFSEPMGSSAKDQAHYTVIFPSGLSRNPSSAILDSQGSRIILTMGDVPGLPQGEYRIIVSGIRDATGVLISDDGNSSLFNIPARDESNWADLGSMVVYPNPVIPGSRHSSQVTFSNLPPDTIIRIYSCDGQLVRDLGAVEPGSSRKIWYLVNDQHQDVASGIYVYNVHCASQTRTGKVAVIR